MPNKQGAEFPASKKPGRGGGWGRAHGNRACVKPGNPEFLPLPSKERQDVDFFNGASGKTELWLGRPRSHGGV